MTTTLRRLVVEMDRDGIASVLSRVESGSLSAADFEKVLATFHRRHRTINLAARKVARDARRYLRAGLKGIKVL
jgi:hypothetical protein